MTTPTQSAPARERIDHWTARLRSSFPMDLRQVPGEPLVIEMEVRPVGAVAGSWQTSSGLRTIRSEEHIRAHDPELFVLYLLVSGAMTISSAHGDERLGPGDLFVISSGVPYEMTAHGKNEAISFTIPRAMLGARADALEALAMQRVADPVVHRLVAPMLARLGEAMQHGELGQADADYGELVVSLARALAVDRHGRRSEETGGAARGALLLAQAKAYIETRLHDPALRPGDVAQAQFISVRYLQKLFQAEGVTMLEWMRAARLRKARRDLADPSQAHRTVAEIAASWGFRHPGHFRRAFRAEFGTTPTQFRREMLHAPAWFAGCDASSGV